MRSLLLLLFVLGSLPTIFVKPHLGVLLWTWMSTMNPHKMVWGISYGFPFAMAIGGTTLLAWIISKEKKTIPLSGLSVLFVLFVIWITITTPLAYNTSMAMGKWVLVIKIVAITVAMMAIMRSPERIVALIWVVVLSVGYFGVKGGFFSILSGGNYLVFGPEGTFIGANNALALALIMTLPLMRFLQLNSKEKWIQWGLIGAMLLSLASIITSYSRGALLAMVAMMFVLWLRSRNRLAIATIAFVTAAGVFAAIPDQWFERMSTIDDYEEDSSAQGRIIMWKYAIDIANDNPLTGGGFDVFYVRYLWPRYGLAREDARAVHSIYFEVLGEHGYVGLLLYLSLGFWGYRTGGWLKRNTADIPEVQWAGDLGTMMQASLAGFAVGGVFLNKAYFDLYFTFIALIVATQGVVMQKIKEVEASKTAPASGESSTDPPPDAAPEWTRSRLTY